MRYSWAGMAFGFFMGVFEWLSNGITTPFPFGFAIIAGFVFGAGMAFFTPRLMAKAQAQVKANADTQGEVPVLEGPANHVLNVESRGGLLILTQAHLWFFSHGMNVQNKFEKLEIYRIKQVNASKMLGIIPNAFSVILDSGVEHKFVVSDRNQWMEELHKIRTSLPKTASGL